MAAAKPDEDPIAKLLQEHIAANRALLSGLKYEYSQTLLRAQAGEGDLPSPFDLAQIKKLESQVLNDELYLVGRRLTRRPA